MTLGCLSIEHGVPSPNRTFKIFLKVIMEDEL